MAIISAWIICAIITAAGGFPSDPDNPNYLARTDRELSVLKEAKWFRFPYPGKAKLLKYSTVFSNFLTHVQHSQPDPSGQKESAGV